MNVPRKKIFIYRLFRAFGNGRLDSVWKVLLLAVGKRAKVYPLIKK